MKYNIFNSIATWSLKKRINRINSFYKRACKNSKECFKIPFKKSKGYKMGKEI